MGCQDARHRLFNSLEFDFSAILRESCIDETASRPRKAQSPPLHRHHRTCTRPCRYTHSSSTDGLAGIKRVFVLYTYIPGIMMANYAKMTYQYRLYHSSPFRFCNRRIYPPLLLFQPLDLLGAHILIS